MGAVALYLLLLKATVTSFAGMGSLPQIRQDLVVTAHALTDEQLNQAVLVGRSTPGPVGAYVVAVGYFAGGVAGAIAGLIAVMTPALAAVPLLALMQRWLHIPRVRAAVDAVVIASAALLIVSVIRMATDGVEQFLRALGSAGT
jgi:chromate transporter